MKRYMTMLAVFGAFGCGPMVTEPMPDIPETVEYDTIRIEYGESDLLEEPADGVIRQALVGDPSMMANLTADLVAGSNRLIRDQINLVHRITQTQPTAREEGRWIWDNRNSKPAEDVFMTFVIEEVSPGRYQYGLLAGQSADDKLPLFNGEFTPSRRVEGRQRGSGILVFHFDNAHEVDPASTAPFGRVVLAFRAAGGVRQVRFATFGLRESAAQEPATAIAEYVQLPDLRGRLRFVSDVDFLQDGAPLERMALETAWTPETAGRGRAHLSAGSLELNEVLLEECWDPAHAMVFARATPMIEVPYADGEESACPVALTPFELAPPSPDEPQVDPAIPGPHPEEVDE